MPSRFRLLFLLSALATRTLAEPSTLEHLQVFLTGSFSNSEQARGDQNFRPTVLHIASIWSERTDGPWLYFEQALADAPAHPFRQIVYQLQTRPDGALEMKTYDLANPLVATGAWREPARVANLTLADLVARQDCSLILRWQAGGSFKGGTEGKGCANTLRGAAYSTVEAVFTGQQLTLWERGYNASDVQVWGSIHGGYVFKRVE